MSIPEGNRLLPFSISFFCSSGTNLGTVRAEPTEITRTMSLRTNIVLIDFENVQPSTLEALNQDHFKVYVFVGASQTKLPFDVVSSIQRMGTRAEYVRISGTGSNALDFHIAFYIGHLAASEPSAYFHIISKDKGFDPLVRHLKERKILVSRSKDISDILSVKSTTAKTPGERLEVVVAKLQQQASNRPRTLKTLSSSINSLFNKQLSDEDIHGLVELLKSKGFAHIEANKVSYHMPVLP